MTTALSFEALDYHADATFRTARYRLEGDRDAGWTVRRDGAEWLRLGPGYRALATERCGVCATDLDRHHLPFALPQVTGHEVVARDDDGGLRVVEINASHRARGRGDGCPYCRFGLATHCPDRRTLGIHDLPGGFGAHVLAPVAGIVPVPAGVPAAAAVLAEPFAAAVHAAATVDPRPGDRIAVLGPGRLGLLVVAALAALRRASARDFAVVAAGRHARSLDLARRLGADAAWPVEAGGGSLETAAADVVVDTTGSPDALPLALRLARREVHLKSTHGRPAGGLDGITRLVVDEIALGALPDREAAGVDAAAGWAVVRGRRPGVAWLASGDPPSWLGGAARVVRCGSADEARARFAAAGAGLVPLPDVAVVDSLAGADRVLRPAPGGVHAAVRPRGRILLVPGARTGEAALERAVVDRNLAVTTSRCGDLRRALDLLAGDPALAGLHRDLVTHRFGPRDLRDAFAASRRPDCVKAVIVHPGTGARG